VNIQDDEHLRRAWNFKSPEGRSSICVYGGLSKQLFALIPIIGRDSNVKLVSKHKLVQYHQGKKKLSTLP
jgi:hypothetical protein